jgi:ribosomal protein S25
MVAHGGDVVNIASGSAAARARNDRGSERTGEWSGHMTAAGSEGQRDRGLHARVVNTLGREIVAGSIAAGDFVNLDRLSERFAVSRSVLREALRVLQSLGMVEPRQRVGTQVLPRQAWDLFSP